MAAAVGGLQRGERGYGWPKLHAAGDGGGNGSERIQDIMIANQRQASMFPTTGYDNVELRALGALGVNVSRTNVGANRGSILDDPAFEIAAEVRNVLIVGIEYGGATGGERFDELIFRAGNSGEGIEEFQMNRSYVRHHADIRLGDFGEGANFSGVRHSHLNDCQVVPGFELQQHQREAEMVVQIAFGLQDAELRGQHVGDGFFGGGLTGRTGDANQRLSPELADSRSEDLQGDQGIVDRKQSGIAAEAVPLIFADDGSDRVVFQRSRNEVVAVEALAFHREKERARGEGAGVDGVSVDQFFARKVAGRGGEFCNLR